MDVKSAFLIRNFDNEVYVKRPPSFKNIDYPNQGFKLNKALYDLKQAPTSWYERLLKFLLESVFNRGRIVSTLFLKVRGKIY